MANQDKKTNLTSDNRLLMDQVFQLDALTRLLLKKGIISEGELSRQLEAIRAEFEKKRGATKG
jgi:hypothetical protein